MGGWVAGTVPRAGGPLFSMSFVTSLESGPGDSPGRCRPGWLISRLKSACVEGSVVVGPESGAEPLPCLDLGSASLSPKPPRRTCTELTVSSSEKQGADLHRRLRSGCKHHRGVTTPSWAATPGLFPAGPRGSARVWLPRGAQAAAASPAAMRKCPWCRGTRCLPL